MNLDERGPWTSASNAAADRLCPGRFLAQRGMPELPEQQETSSGIRIHAWLEGKPQPLDPAELELAEGIREKCDGVLRNQFPQGCKLEFERRLWLRLGAKLHSGKPDVLAHDNASILILDYKTGWGFVPESDSNQQLRDLAVLAWENYGIAPVRVAKLQRNDIPYLCEYNAEALERSKFELFHRVEACHQENAPRVAGPMQCQYCRFRPKCPEAKAALDEVPVVCQPQLPSDGKLMAAVLNACALAKKVIADREAEAKAVLQAQPDAIPGWKLVKGRRVRIVTAPETVAGRLSELGIEKQAILSSVTMSLGKIENLIRTTGLKGKELKASMNLVLLGCCEEREDAPSLSRTE